MSRRISPCKGCGCTCEYCNDQVALHLHAEIENLKQRLIERENHIVTMETNFLREADKFPNGEMAAISDELLTWQDKYSRLYEAHKRVQKVNQNLEDKLLRIVDKCETEKNALTTEVSNLTRRLVDEKFNVAKLQEENERYRNDVNLAIQLLQCKPSNFVSQKYDSLPSDMQQKVRTYISAKRRQSDGNGNIAPKPEMKTIKVPIPTFPPTAMVYSVNKGPVEKDANWEEKPQQAPVDIVSAAIMAKVLEEREKERANTTTSRHCDSCSCQTKANRRQQQAVWTQTEWPANTEVAGGAMAVRGKEKDRERARARARERERSREEAAAAAAVVAVDGDGDGGAGGWNNDWDVECGRRDEAVAAAAAGEVAEAVLVNIEPEERPSGPRHCSVRMQPGTNNILLDNALRPYNASAVLYKSRADPLPVHHSSTSASATTSASSSRSASTDSSTADQPSNNHKPSLRTETQI